MVAGDRRTVTRLLNKEKEILLKASLEKEKQLEQLDVYIERYEESPEDEELTKEIYEYI